MVPLLGIDYSEPPDSPSEAPLNYRGVILRMGLESEQEVFATGDPTVDYLTAGFVAHYRVGPEAPVMCSSSVDHFAMDGGQLDDEDPSEEQIQKAVRAGRAYLTARGEDPQSQKKEAT